MLSAVEVLGHLQACGVELYVTPDGTLQRRHRRGAWTPDVAALVATHRADLLAMLANGAPSLLSDRPPDGDGFVRLSAAGFALLASNVIAATRDAA